jgi:hypothetical protein
MALRSDSSIHIVDLISEGVIGGFAGLTEDCVFLDDTPLSQYESADNAVDLTLGGKNQRPPLNLLGQDASLDTVQNVGVEVGSNYEETVDSENKVISRNYGEGFVVRSVTDPTVEKVSLLITINRLFSTAIEGLGRGQLFNATVRFGISFYGPLGSAVQSIAGGTEFNVTGITTSGFQLKTPQYDIARFGYPCFIRLHKFKNIKVEDRVNYKPVDFSVRPFGVASDNPEAAFEATYLTLTETPDPDRLALASGRGNQITWSQLILHKPTHINYGHSACAALTINTKDISSLPSRSYLIKGIKVPIPSNMATRDDGSLYPIFATDFDGTAKAAEWTTCPVCIWRHMLLNTRFGAGDFVSAENVSWVDLYPLIRYANEYVLVKPIEATYFQNFVEPTTGETRFNITVGSNHGYVVDQVINVFFTSGDLLGIHDVCQYLVKATNPTQVAVIPYATQLGNTGSGGSCLVAKQAEPRFACNTVISSQAQAFDVLQDLASVFRGMMYWQTNGITATADHGELFKSGGLDNNVPPVHLFSNSNVIDGRFDYETSSVKTRSTSIKVRYNSPDNNYRPDTVVVEDPELREKYGHQVREIVAFGCTSRTQAARMGRWMLASEKLAGNLVKFATGLDGAVVLPGQVFSVADEMRAGNRYSGRVRAATAGTITLDANLNLPPGSNLEITCTLDDGIVETRSVSSTSTVDGYTQVTISVAWTKVPSAGSVYSLSTDSVNEQKFRCVSISDNGDGTYGMVGVQHNDSIYAVADVAGNTLEPLKISSFTDFPARPTAVKVTFRPVQTSGNLFFQMLVSWERGATGTTVEYEARIFVNNQPFKKIATDQQFIKLDTESLVLPNAEVTVTIVAKGLKFGEVNPSETVKVTAPNAGILQSAKFLPAEDTVVLPQDITGLVIRRFDEATGQIEFDPIQNENPEQLRLVVRASTASDGGSWGKSVFIKEFPIAANDISVPYQLAFTGDTETPAKYYAKLRNIKTNAQSANAAVADVEDLSPINKYTDSNLTINETNANPSLNLKGIRSKTVGKVADGLVLQSRFIEEYLTGEAEQNIRRTAIGTFEQTVVTTGTPPLTITTGTIVVTLNSHPFIVGDYVNLVLGGIKNSSAPYEIEAVTTNTFTVTSKESVPAAIAAGTPVTIFKSALSGEYIFDNQLDLGGKYEVLLNSVVENDTTDVDGVTGAKLYYRTNLDEAQLVETGGILDEAGTDFILLEDGGEIVVESFTQFTPWKPFVKTLATGRVFQFKLELTGKGPRTPIISKLGVKAQLLERTEVGIVSPGVITALNMFEFTNAFYKKPEGTTGKMTGEVKVDQTTTINSTSVTGLVSDSAYKAQIFPFTPLLADLTVVPEGRAFHANVLDSSNNLVAGKKIEYTATGFGKKLA